MHNQGQKYLSQEKSDKYSHCLEHLNKMQFMLVFLILFPPPKVSNLCGQGYMILMCCLYLPFSLISPSHQKSYRIFHSKSQSNALSFGTTHQWGSTWLHPQMNLHWTKLFVFLRIGGTYHTWDPRFPSVVIRRTPSLHPLRLQPPHFQTSPVNNKYFLCLHYLIAETTEERNYYLLLLYTVPTFSLHDCVSNLN